VNLPSNTALLIIDVQRAIDDPSWAADGPRNNPDAEANIAALLAEWRRLGLAIFHVKHDGTFATSTYRPGQPGNDFKPEAAPLLGETIIAKHTNSAFIGTELDCLLRRAKISTLIICGVITNNSVEATVRMAGNLGFDTYLEHRRRMGDGAILAIHVRERHFMDFFRGSQPASVVLARKSEAGIPSAVLPKRELSSDGTSPRARRSGATVRLRVRRQHQGAHGRYWTQCRLEVYRPHHPDRSARLPFVAPPSACFPGGTPDRDGWPRHAAA
jgi:hypothetical protein